jgi:methyltransferase-like protein/SAM-dependent methyltransferase
LEPGIDPSVAYDEVLYPGHAFAQTHPDRLATMARLFGMNPAGVESCRVLELGCGDGGNLIPMAYALPGSEFVGLDVGARGIAKGQETCRQLGLGNISLRHLDLMQVSEELSDFDFIVSHGVYSWVPPEVQAKMLEVCSTRLNRNGVAYISYNAYPGAHLRQMIAEMMKYHARHFDRPEEKIAQARAMLSFLSAASSSGGGYDEFLREEIKTIATHRPASLFHDELAPVNSPLYFHEFIRQAAGHHLQYLAEAAFHEMQDPNLLAQAAEVLKGLRGNPIEREQYLDFLKCRRFRQTLLCHADVALNRQLNPSAMRGFFASATPRFAMKPDETMQAVGKIDGLNLKQAVAGKGLEILAESWPRVWQFPELLAEAQSRAGATSADDEPAVCAMMLACFAAAAVELHLYRPRYVLRVSERPMASALARLQLRDDCVVTNLRHDAVRLEDELSRRLLAALDGTRNHRDLLDHLAKGVDPSNPAQAQFITMENLERSLSGLARHALLVG